MSQQSIQQRAVSLSQLGTFLRQTLRSETVESAMLQPVLRQAIAENPWFTNESIRQALNYWAEHLSLSHLEVWLSHYEYKAHPPKRVLLILAGNLPLVGFHDVVSTYLSGHIAVIKASQKDRVLLRFVLEQLVKVDPNAQQHIDWTEHTTTNFEAVIATGSANSGRYFDYYFKKYPHLIRRNRTSLAYLSAKTSTSDLDLLRSDIFDFFGLGCRSVNHLILQRGFDLQRLVDQLQQQTDVTAHNKYMNNLEYHRSVLLMNRAPFIETPSVLLIESTDLLSPIGVLHYQWVSNANEAQAWIAEHREQIQCMVNIGESPVSFGEAQHPGLTEYADQIDTLHFLLSL